MHDNGVRHLFSLETALDIFLNSKNRWWWLQRPYQNVKSKIFCVFNLLIWRQNESLALGNSLFDRCRKVEKWLSFWTKYNFPRQINPRFHELSIRRSQSNLQLSLLFVSCEKRLLSCRFGRTAQFWLPVILRAQSPNASASPHKTLKGTPPPTECFRHFLFL